MLVVLLRALALLKSLDFIILLKFMGARDLQRNPECQRIGGRAVLGGRWLAFIVCMLSLRAWTEVIGPVAAHGNGARRGGKGGGHVNGNGAGGTERRTETG